MVFAKGLLTWITAAASAALEQMNRRRGRRGNNPARHGAPRTPWDAVLIGGLLLAMVLSPLADFGARCAQVRQEVLRLHILAASDQPQDQANKLLVRDALLDQLGTRLGSAHDTQEALDLAEASLDQVEAIARQTLDAAGCSDPVRAQRVRMHFDTRVYDNATLPAGEYEALRVVIGPGQGQNWWCVMFPPLCIPAAARAEETGREQQILLLEEEPNYKLAFWSVELVEKALEQLHSS